MMAEARRRRVDDHILPAMKRAYLRGHKVLGYWRAWLHIARNWLVHNKTFWVVWWQRRPSTELVMQAVYDRAFDAVSKQYR